MRHSSHGQDKNMKQHSKSRGFTLPEIIITLGIIAIVLSTAVPSISSMIKDNRLATHLNSVVTHIHIARAEAAKRDVRVIMCRSSSPNATTPSCGGSENVWTDGYIVFADNGNYSNNWYDSGTDTLLIRGQPAASGVRMRTSETWNKNLEFNPDGSTYEDVAASMWLCDDRGKEYGREIQVATSGIIRMISDNLSKCKLEP
jgi:type IV fimbrial biogenesis protein FimT